LPYEFNRIKTAEESTNPIIPALSYIQSIDIRTDPVLYNYYYKANQTEFI